MARKRQLPCASKPHLIAKLVATGDAERARVAVAISRDDFKTDSLAYRRAIRSMCHSTAGRDLLYSAERALARL